MKTPQPEGAAALSMALLGLDGHIVNIHAAREGAHSLQILWLSDTQARETSIRVRSALHQVGVEQSACITVRLTSEVPVRGAVDLAVAAAVLTLLLGGSHSRRGRTVVLGELALSGAVRPVRGVLPALRAAVALGIPKAVVPRANAREAAHVPGIQVHVLEHIDELVRHLREGIPLEPVPVPSAFVPAAPAADMSDLTGMPQAPRALEIAAAGGHGLLLVGPPGSGKTMLARRLSGILPPLTLQEANEVTAIHSAAGLLPTEVGLLRSRPFRAPHHTVSAVGLVGGGDQARPAEVSLAHTGVLFLDELPEFRRSTLDALRQPLEDGAVTTWRGGHRATFPSRVLVVAAANPCPCGYRGEPDGRCSCSPERVKSYLARLQGPLSDRFDLCVVLRSLQLGELQTRERGESSAEVQKRVVLARVRQTERRGPGTGTTNAELTGSDLERFAALDSVGSAALATAVDRLRLARDDRSRVLRVARTVADLDDSDSVRGAHLDEALRCSRLASTFP